MEDAVKDLFVLLDQYPGTWGKTKLHALKCHVMPFVKKYGSWGLYSEQCKQKRQFSN